ncbi:MAG: glycine cleavage system aminomethyltransferase GcvT [Muribaculaceae bacterium]|nr:glycine cleavage system aminomethyltransferase GcvT [Muribaculaceae bacterium]
MENSEIKKTCLHDRHTALGAKMAPFAGFDMPIEYAGLDAEHQAVRTAVGVFDVSHMGEVIIEGPDAERFVNHIFTNDVTAISAGQILYGMMTYEDGGTVDDLLVYKVADDCYLLVINAANIDKDIEWILSAADGYNVAITDLCDAYGELAVQGPDAERILSAVTGVDLSQMGFYTFEMFDGEDASLPVVISRTGYTGEDGFEVYDTNERIVELWDALMASGVQPCGLGCRDTLRFEAGLPLYGDELTAEISPLESGLGMFVKLDKPEGFIGSDALKTQKEAGVKKKVVGLEIDSPATARHGFEVLDAEGVKVGEITTGYRSLTLGRNLAMALVDARCAALGTPLQVRIRKKTVPATIVKKRFYTTRYKK